MLDPAQHGRRRRVAGVMSGTSVDGIDVAIATMEGSGRGIRVSDVHHFAIPYAESVRNAILKNSVDATSSVVELSQLNVRLAHLYAAALEAAQRAVREGALEDTPEDTPGAGAPSPDAGRVDLIGIHGQTVQHVPSPRQCCGEPTRSTFQIGDPSTVANLLGIPVVGDFRMADMAVGGQGAPLVSYFDKVVLSHETENRIALNLGGIANFTVLPAANGTTPFVDLAMDTGPANMVLDALAARFLGRRFDAAGAVAATGVVDELEIAVLMDDPYFSLPPPKTTGREMFGTEFVQRMVSEMEERGTGSVENLLATAAEFTARSIHLAYKRFVAPDDQKIDRVIVSGGGTQNDHLMARIRHVFSPVAVDLIDEHGVPSAAKEALCFGLLAHEFVNGVATNVPSATGARSATMLGKLCLPSSTRT